MDNQQATFLCKENFDKASLHDLAWLAGIMDGEGSISTNPTLSPDRKHRTLNVQINIANSDSAILERVTRTLDALNIGYHAQDKSSKRNVVYIVITSVESKLYFLMYLYGGLTRLRPQARLAIRFYTSRVKRKAEAGTSRLPYNISEIETFIELLEINKPSGNRKKSSEAIRAAFAEEYASDDMVRSHVRA